jgi:hypothetical protein
MSVACASTFINSQSCGAPDQSAREAHSTCPAGRVGAAEPAHALTLHGHTLLDFDSPQKRCHSCDIKLCVAERLIEILMVGTQSCRKECVP